MKGRYIIIAKVLKQLALDQLYVNYMGIEKKLLVHESIYWVNVNNDIENYVKNCSTYLDFQQAHPKERTIHHGIPMRPCDVIGANMFQHNNKNYICIVDYHSKFPVVKGMGGLSVDSLIARVKVIFVEYGIPHRIMSDAESNFISEKFKNFWNSLNFEQAVSSSYHIKVTDKYKSASSSSTHYKKVHRFWWWYTHMAMLQIRTTPLGQGHPSPTMLLFNCLVRGIMPVMDRPPINIDNDMLYFLINRTIFV